jgi:CRP/FNR family transcriptional regulator, dissimilatory nitrate respiration regulator
LALLFSIYYNSGKKAVTDVTKKVILMYLEWIKVLQSSALFRGISQDSLNIMLDCLKPRLKRYRMREVIVICGQPFEGVGIIARGKVALTRETCSGNRIMMEILSAGEIFGEMVAFSTGKVWPMTVIAQDDCVVLFLPPEKITGTCSNICASHTTLILNMLQILSHRALMLNQKIEHLSAKHLRGKISSYLLELYRQEGKTSLTIPMKRHELADYLNIPRPSLSREMGLMRDSGIIDFNGRRVIIKNGLKLEEALK